jgi:hypothetical protein
MFEEIVAEVDGSMTGFHYTKVDKMWVNSVRYCLTPAGVSTSGAWVWEFKLYLDFY